MEDPKGKTRCKFYNSGYCKFADKCKFRHFKTICSESKCRSNTCTNRHPKLCRFKDEFRRRTSCLYIHVDNDITSNTEKELELQNFTLRTEFKELYKITKTMESKIKQISQELQGINTKYKDMRRQATIATEANEELKRQNSVLQKENSPLKNKSTM